MIEQTRGLTVQGVPKLDRFKGKSFINMGPKTNYFQDIYFLYRKLMVLCRITDLPRIRS